MARLAVQQALVILLPTSSQHWNDRDVPLCPGFHMGVVRGELSSSCLCDGRMMWDSPLYARNMFYYHWLIKKPMAGQNIARLEEIHIESR